MASSSAGKTDKDVLSNMVRAESECTAATKVPRKKYRLQTPSHNARVARNQQLLSSSKLQTSSAVLDYSNVASEADGPMGNQHGNVQSQLLTKTLKPQTRIKQAFSSTNALSPDKKAQSTHESRYKRI